MCRSIIKRSMGPRLLLLWKALTADPCTVGLPRDFLVAFYLMVHKITNLLSMKVWSEFDLYLINGYIDIFNIFKREKK
jgi:hypothetical protein